MQLYPSHSKERLAQGWYDEMPEKAVDIILNKHLSPGASLVRMDSDLSKATFKDF